MMTEDAMWRKSSRSNSSGGACVELACSGDLRGVRDSKNPTGPTLRFGQARLAAFLEEVRTGRFDG
ncbi:DUF397 domain-containing protein [Saccharothrix coeruleofusca]|uniref:DUF397 domain-containing protein n=1 Tax=Saccharothrix coeruleofusca TaxID=33919 RepID=A0A918AU58_9PSEU|nr:DUF397 domain-containing protein [Saccharothrix coeruleofusca]GGP85699.1 hypothetical protein GCM10010185_69260 [Saccharothrix coeruleofusca]